MNRRIEIGALVLAALLALGLPGCKKDNQEPADANTTTGAQLKDKADQALQATTDFLAQQKDRLLQASQAQLNKLEHQVDEWLGEAGIEDEQVRQKVDAMSQGFRGALGEARQAIETARAGGIEAWQQVKPTVTAAVEKAQQTHDEVMAYLKDRARKLQETEAGSAGPVVEE